MVGQDADRGDSRVNLKANRRAVGAHRRDLEAGSLARWARRLDAQRRELLARVDEEMVLSVVSNLLANALKHAPAGGTVRCTVAGVGERLRIEVADSGPGVADALREQIFERYRQGPGSAGRPGGTGLGLAIVRDLVALHHGMVTLADAPEGGALFVV